MKIWTNKILLNAYQAMWVLVERLIVYDLYADLLYAPTKRKVMSILMIIRNFSELFWQTANKQKCQITGCKCDDCVIDGDCTVVDGIDGDGDVVNTDVTMAANTFPTTYKKW